MKQRETWLLVMALLLIGGVPLSMAEQIQLKQDGVGVTPLGGVGDAARINASVFWYLGQEWFFYLVILPLLAVDFVFLGANALKLLSGGFVPLVMGGAIFVLMAVKFLNAPLPVAVLLAVGGLWLLRVEVGADWFAYFDRLVRGDLNMPPHLLLPHPWRPRRHPRERRRAPQRSPGQPSEAEPPAPPGRWHPTPSGARTRPCPRPRLPVLESPWPAGRGIPSR